MTTSITCAPSVTPTFLPARVNPGTLFAMTWLFEKAASCAEANPAPASTEATATATLLTT